MTVTGGNPPWSELRAAGAGKSLGLARWRRQSLTAPAPFHPFPPRFCCRSHCFSVCLEIESKGILRPSVQSGPPVSSPPGRLALLIPQCLRWGARRRHTQWWFLRCPFSCDLLLVLLAGREGKCVSRLLTGEGRRWSSDWAGRNLQLVTPVTLGFVAVLWHLPLTVCLVFRLHWKPLGNWGPLPLLSRLALSQAPRAGQARPAGWFPSGLPFVPTPAGR